MFKKMSNTLLKIQKYQQFKKIKVSKSLVCLKEKIIFLIILWDLNQEVIFL